MNKNLIRGIKEYCDDVGIQRSFFQKDVLTCFRNDTAERANIITISYLISYLYNTNQTNLIMPFFENLADNVILKKKPNEKVLIIINDVNSNRRGRDFFNLLSRILKRKGARVNSEFKYFDTGDLNFFQKVGSAYASTECLFDIPTSMKAKYNVFSSLSSSCEISFSLFPAFSCPPLSSLRLFSPLSFFPSLSFSLPTAQRSYSSEF